MKRIAKSARPLDVRLATCAGLCVVALAAIAAADEPKPPEDAAPGAGAAASHARAGHAEADHPVAGHAAADHAIPERDASGPGPKSRPRGDDVVSVMVLLLGGILMLAGVAFATILIWGNRVRRSLRAPPSRTGARDDLWYLKPRAGLPPRDPPTA